jgi:hypothetical protein
VSIDGPGREQLREVAQALKDAGEEGRGFRRNLVNQLDEAAQPLARKIADAERLKPYMPDRYAAVLAADLAVTTQKLFAGASPRVSVVAKGRAHKRKVQLTEDGVINHPVFAQGLRRTWDWENGQVKGMRPGWFSDPCEKEVPQIRGHVLEALEETFREVAP